MSNSRFLLRNMLRTEEGAYLLNGDGGYTDVTARNEVAPWLMERVQDGERETKWRCGAATPYYVDFDLSGIGSNIMSGWAALGITNGTNQLKVHSRATYDGDALDWTQRAGPFTTSAQQRDAGGTFPTVNNVAFWRFEFFAAPTCGTLWLGAAVDLGILYSPTSESSPTRHRIEQVYPDGSMVINDLGGPGRNIVLRFIGVRDATRVTLESLSEQPGSFVYLDPLDRPHEVICPRGSVTVQHDFIDRFTIEVPLLKLP